MKLEILGYSDTRTLEKKRKQILAVAKQLFIQIGIEQTSMKIIAARADITRRSLYNYYESKDLIAIDVQMLNMTELRFFQTWGIDNTRGDISGLLERIPQITQQSVNEHRDHYIMINRFESYFNNGYPDNRYRQFIQNGLSEVYSGDFNETSNSEYNRSWLKVNLLLSHLQRLALQSKKNTLEYEDVREEVELLCLLINNSEN